MTPAIQTLMNEHRVIEQVLGALETFASDGGTRLPDAREWTAKFGAFFRDFADRIHHGKEEERLFVAMIESGFPRDGGPIAVMLAEHVEGRSHVRALCETGATGAGPLPADDQAKVVAHAVAYAPLLRAHIQKEDNILYPMAERMVPRAVMAALAASFEAFDREQLGAASVESHLAAAAGLAAAFPPDPVKMSVAATMGCGARG